MVFSEKVQRSFIVGDSWLYYKIYTGPKTSDTILTEIIKPAVTKFLEKNLINQWFFIRYADPKYHLRLRFHYRNPDDIGKIVNALRSYFKEYIDQDLIWKIQIDTYQREIGRYGVNTMELSEQLFFHDSKMIVDFISLIEGEEGEELRWLFSLRAMDSYLKAYGYSDEEKLAFIEQLKIGFGNEFGMSRSLKKQLDDKFRSKRKKIDEFMEFKIEHNLAYAPILSLIKTRNQDAESIVSNTLRLKSLGELQIGFDHLMGSYLHMFMNRLFTSKNRLHEMVCYDFLYRYYKSMIAKKNATAKTVKTIL